MSAPGLTSGLIPVSRASESKASLDLDIDEDELNELLGLDSDEDDVGTTKKKATSKNDLNQRRNVSGGNGNPMQDVLKSLGDLDDMDSSLFGTKKPAGGSNTGPAASARRPVADPTEGMNTSKPWMGTSPASVTSKEDKTIDPTDILSAAASRPRAGRRGSTESDAGGPPPRSQVSTPSPEPARPGSSAGILPWDTATKASNVGFMDMTTAGKKGGPSSRPTQATSKQPVLKEDDDDDILAILGDDNGRPTAAAQRQTPAPALTSSQSKSQSQPKAKPAEDDFVPAFLLEASGPRRRRGPPPTGGGATGNGNGVSAFNFGAGVGGGVGASAGQMGVTAKPAVDLPFLQPKPKPTISPTQAQPQGQSMGFAGKGGGGAPITLPAVQQQSSGLPVAKPSDPGERVQMPTVIIPQRTSQQAPAAAITTTLPSSATTPSSKPVSSPAVEETPKAQDPASAPPRSISSSPVSSIQNLSDALSDDEDDAESGPPAANTTSLSVPAEQKGSGLGISGSTAAPAQANSSAAPGISRSAKSLQDDTSRARLEEEIRALTSSLATVQSTLATQTERVTELEREATAHRAAATEWLQQKEEAVKEVEGKWKGEMKKQEEAMTQSHKNEIEVLTEKHKKEVQDVEARCALELETLKVAHDSTAHIATLTSQLQTQSVALDGMRKEVEGEAREWMEKWNAMMEDRERKAHELQDHLLRKERDLEVEREKVQTAIKTMERTVLETKRQHEEDRLRIAEERARLDGEMAELKTAKEELQMRLHAERVDFLKSKEEWALERRRMREAIEEERKALFNEKSYLEAQKHAIEEFETEVKIRSEREREQLQTDRLLHTQQTQTLHARMAELHRQTAQLRTERNMVAMLRDEVEAEKEVVEGELKEVERRVRGVEGVRTGAAEERKKAESAFEQTEKAREGVEVARAKMEQTLQRLEEARKSFYEERMALAVARRKAAVDGVSQSFRLEKNNVDEPDIVQNDENAPDIAPPAEVKGTSRPHTPTQPTLAWPSFPTKIKPTPASGTTNEDNAKPASAPPLDPSTMRKNKIKLLQRLNVHVAGLKHSVTDLEKQSTYLTDRLYRIPGATKSLPPPRIFLDFAGPKGGFVENEFDAGVMDVEV
ncbi:hypothetical protein HDV00_009830 [Rhizophlyctis rosea]|nr:hypothetical protein HDV00_009830 [Rhizophlyctis rosea]